MAPNLKPKPATKDDPEVLADFVLDTLRGTYEAMGIQNPPLPERAAVLERVKADLAKQNASNSSGP